MLIQMFAFPNYYVIVLAAGKYLVFLLVPNLRFWFSKLGPPAKINLIWMKSGFSTLCCRLKKLSEAHRNISVFKIPL